MKFLTGLLFALLLCTARGNINAQVLLDENFNYTAGDSIGAHGWTGFSSFVNVIKVASPGLTYSGYPLSNIGNSCRLSNNGQDAYIGYTAVNTGSVYAAFMVRIDSARTAGDYFAALLPSTSTTNFTGRMFVKDTTGGIKFGLSKSTETVQYAPSVYSYGTTYLLVIKYTFNSGTTTDDQLSLFVLSGSFPFSEPVPDVGPFTGTAADNANMGRFALRQGSASNAGTLNIDGIRISTNWPGFIAPAAPTLSLPSNGAGNVPLTTLLDWSDVSGASTYNVQVATDTAFTNIVINQSGLAASQYSITSGLNNNTQYYWRASAVNGAGTSPYSSVFTFTTVVAVPSAPTLSTPANGATGVSLTPTLDWNDVSGASTYTLHVATDSAFSNVIINQSGLASSQYSVSSGVLSNNTKYYWRVSATNAGGTSAYSTSFSFTTVVAAPSAPALTSPANNTAGVSLTPLFDWNDVSGASSYRIQISADSTFAATLKDTSGVLSSQYQLPGGILSNNVKYYWRVSATNAGGTSAYSTAFSFTTIVAAPSTPSLVVPVNNATGVPLAPLFDWNDVSGASSYRIQISTDSNFATTVKDTSGVPASQYQLPGGILSNSVKYYWRVNATNAGGTSAYSNVFGFTTIVSAPSAPNLTAPSNNATGVSLTPLFDWNDVNGASSYRIQISADSTFAATVKDTSGVLSSQYQVPGGILNFQVKYYWRVSATNAGGTSAYSSRFSFTTLPLPPAQVQFTVIPAGLYNPGTGRLNMKDTVKVYLVDSANCLKVDSAKGVIDSVTFSATLSFSSVNTGKYYLFVYHRNHIAIATKLTQNVIRNSSVSYNFTTDSAKAFGNNMIKLGASLWGMIPGDGNRDGFVDGLDQTIWINQNGSDGYLAGDYNGDGFVDGLDQTIWILWNGQSFALPCNILDIFNFYPGGGTVTTTPIENNKTKR